MSFKYQSIANQIREQLLSNEYKPGEKLPSIHKLSCEMSCNPDTVIKAYQLLESEHLVYAVSKSGFYAVKSKEKAENRKKIIDMRTAGLSDNINPYIDFFHCMEQAAFQYGKRLFDYAPPQGLPELIQVLTKHMTEFHIFTKANDVFVTNGSQQALSILTAMPFPNGRSTVLVEQPTYSFILQILKCNGIDAAGIARGKDGIDMGELEAIFRKGDIKFFYTMPRYQNPTGYSYTNNQKKDILRLAAKYNVYIVEDDYLADLEVDTKTDTMFGLDESHHTVYVRSFSKTLLPGLRLGMAILPQSLQCDFILRKQCMDLNTSPLTQGALEIYLRSSMYRHHVQRTRKYFQKKMNLVKENYERYLLGKVRCRIPITGIFAYIELENSIAGTLQNRLSKSGVLVSNADDSFISQFRHPQAVRLCICKPDSSEISEAFDLIKRYL